MAVCYCTIAVLIILTKFKMENLIENDNNALDLSKLGEILSIGATAGVAIANYTKTQPKVGALIGGGLSLLLCGLLLATNEEEKKSQY